jgi:hypothetical protein
MNKPTHEEISQRAHKIWQDTGSTFGGNCDADAHWLEAERQLDADSAKSHSHPAVAEHAAAHPLSESRSTLAVAERTAQQRKESRKPKVPTHTGPKLAPPESGKPLWNQPHSS